VAQFICNNQARVFLAFNRYSSNKQKIIQSLLFEQEAAG